MATVAKINTVPVDAAGGGGGSSFKSGTYTGDGTTSQAITGVGFQPEYVRILGYSAAVEITADFPAGTSWHSNNEHGTDMIISIDADGFTVDDGGGDADPNVNGFTYYYIAMKS